MDLSKCRWWLFEDLFPGKLNAALDRPHLRDLYDVKLLFENEGLTDGLFRTFLIYLASSGRPPHELLDPNLLDLDKPSTNEFTGMTNVPVAVGALFATRTQLIADMQSRLNERATMLLQSLIDGVPDVEVIGLPQSA